MITYPRFTAGRACLTNDSYGPWIFLVSPEPGICHRHSDCLFAMTVYQELRAEAGLEFDKEVYDKWIDELEKFTPGHSFQIDIYED